MRVFLDTNVLLDYLLAREPFYKDAVILVDLCSNSTFHGIISSLTVVNCFYILRKAYPIDIVYDYVNWMIQAFDVSNIDSQVIHKAYSAKRDDFEDMVQYYSALKQQCRGDHNQR